MKIVMIGEAANHQEKLSASLSQPCDVVCLPAEAAGHSSFDAEIDGADVVISLRYRRRDTAPRFALLHVPGAGLDGIDLASLPPGCTVCNVFEHDVPIAEFVLLAMLQWQIRLDDMRERFSPETWTEAYRHRVPHGELLGQTLGLIGFGRIGRAIARRAEGFGLAVAYCDVVPAEGFAYPRYASAAALAANSDILVAAVSGGEATRGLVDAAVLEALGHAGFFVNVSRGSVVDEAALIDALARKRIAGAALDVFWNEPNIDRRFFDFDSVILEPHQSSATVETRRAMGKLVRDNLEAHFAGRPLLTQVA